MTRWTGVTAIVVTAVTCSAVMGRTERCGARPACRRATGSSTNSPTCSKQSSGYSSSAGLMNKAPEACERLSQRAHDIARLIDVHEPVRRWISKAETDFRLSDLVEADLTPDVGVLRPIKSFVSWTCGRPSTSGWCSPSPARAGCRTTLRQCIFRSAPCWARTANHSQITCSWFLPGSRSRVRPAGAGAVLARYADGQTSLSTQPNAGRPVSLGACAACGGGSLGSPIMSRAARMASATPGSAVSGRLASSASPNPGVRKEWSGRA